MRIDGFWLQTFFLSVCPANRNSHRRLPHPVQIRMRAELLVNRPHPHGSSAVVLTGITGKVKFNGFPPPGYRPLSESAILPTGITVCRDPYFVRYRKPATAIRVRRYLHKFAPKETPRAIPRKFFFHMGRPSSSWPAPRHFATGSHLSAANAGSESSGCVQPNTRPLSSDAAVTVARDVVQSACCRQGAR